MSYGDIIHPQEQGLVSLGSGVGFLAEQRTFYFLQLHFLL